LNERLRVGAQHGHQHLIQRHIRRAVGIGNASGSVSGLDGDGLFACLVAALAAGALRTGAERCGVIPRGVQVQFPGLQPPPPALCAWWGSNSMVLRVSRPVFQLASTTRSTNGSFTGRSLLRRSTVEPLGRFRISIWTRVTTGEYSMPWARKVSGVAVVTRSVSASEEVTCTSSISARRGSPKADLNGDRAQRSAKAFELYRPNDATQAAAKAEYFQRCMVAINGLDLVARWSGLVLVMVICSLRSSV
jgi:hypothetical protein